MKVSGWINKENTIFATKVAVGTVALGGITYLVGYGATSLGAELVRQAVKDSFQEKLGSIFQYAGSGLYIIGI